MNFIIEPSRETPVINEVDIVVVGGGCTGVFAAIRAARLGAKVAIIEASNAFGGVATNGFVCVWHTLCDMTFNKQIISGLTEETIERLKKIPHGIKIILPRDDQKHIFRKSTYANYHLNTEELKIELDKMILEAGVPIIQRYYVLRISELSKLFIIKFAEPLFACVFGAVILNEDIFKLQYLAAFILISAGIFIGHIRQRRKDR